MRNGARVLVRERVERAEEEGGRGMEVERVGWCVCRGRWESEGEERRGEEAEVGVEEEKGRLWEEMKEGVGKRGVT